MNSRIVAIPVLAAIWLGSPVPALAQDQEPRHAQSRPPETRSEKRSRERASRGNHPYSAPYRPPYYAPVYYGGYYPFYAYRYTYPPYAAYPVAPYGPTSYDMGAVRLQIRPSDAEVFVDGYYAGHVDDFDGSFQSLRLDQGGHKIEVRMPGLQTFEIDVHVQPGRTLTIHQDLHP